MYLYNLHVHVYIGMFYWLHHTRPMFCKDAYTSVVCACLILAVSFCQANAVRRKLTPAAEWTVGTGSVSPPPSRPTAVSVPGGSPVPAVTRMQQTEVCLSVRLFVYLAKFLHIIQKTS